MLGKIFRDRIIKGGGELPSLCDPSPIASKVTKKLYLIVFSDKR